MASLTNEGASSSSSIHRWKYDVFLSFRGTDTRNNFTHYLHKALCDNRIDTFIDDEIQKGEGISMELINAIESSRNWIVVFSKNFAVSPWCLDELVKIFECRSDDRKIFPIFYKVNPSDLCKQDGEFGIALTKHEEKYENDTDLEKDKKQKDKVQKWRETLAVASKLSGFHYKDSCTESEFIQSVIQSVKKVIPSTKLNHVPLFVAKHPVGIDIRVKAIELLLDMGSNDDCMVGIYGLGGMGKTTISKAVYNKIAESFDESFFLEDVRERSKIHDGKIKLQDTILSKILPERNLKEHNVSEGTYLIMDTLKSKKVLLILDDVGESKEVENLLGKCNWFAPGSRVIITTRDKRVLTSLGIDRGIYEVKKLSQSEAHDLFIKHAFQTSKCEEDYSELANKIISYADGLPLALKIIGSDLCGGNIQEWKDALESYESIPHENIQEKLQISFDRLQKHEKNIFLDIACFFKGYDKDDVVNILDSCDLHSKNGIRKLIDKCLVTLEYGHLSMHDLVQQMGRDIVRQESEELEKRSRIWRYKDAHKLLTGNMGSNEIRSILFISPERKEVSLNSKVFKKMKKLKFLIGNVHIGEKLEYLPDELRFLEWREFPLSLSSKCRLPQQLVVLKISNNILEKAFKQGFQFENLKIINMRGSESITKLPDLCSPNLEKLNLSYCKNLTRVHKSIGHLEKLKVWNLNGCSRLQILPSTLKLKSLEYFSLMDCSRLKKFPDIHPEMNRLKELYLEHSGIRELPSSLLYLTGLETLLGLHYCSKLTKFLQVRGNKSETHEEEEVDIPYAELRRPCNSFSNFSAPKSIGFLGLTELNLRGCVGIEVNLDSWMQPDYFPVLIELNLCYTGIVTIPEIISKFTRLQYLHLSHCKDLLEIPRLPQSIRTVDAQNCRQLDTKSSSRLWNQFGEILGILPNTVAQAATIFQSIIDHDNAPRLAYHYLLLPAIEIPKWFKFNHHQSVGNSISFLVGPKFSNFVVCFVFPSDDVSTNLDGMWFFNISINGVFLPNMSLCYSLEDMHDHAWLFYGKVNIPNPSKENYIKVEVIPEKGINTSLTRMRIYVECNCCPQKPNISPVSSMDQWAFNNGEEDSGRVGIQYRLQRRNHRSTHARRSQKHYLGWLRVRFQLWQRSSKPWRRRITNGLHDQGSSSIPNTFLNEDTNANQYPPSKKTKTC